YVVGQSTGTARGTSGVDLELRAAKHVLRELEVRSRGHEVREDRGVGLAPARRGVEGRGEGLLRVGGVVEAAQEHAEPDVHDRRADRKSSRLNSSHVIIT